MALLEGQNDGSTNTTTALTAVLNGLLSALPSKAKIFVLRPLGAAQAAAQSTYLQAGIAACSDPTRVVWIDTTGFFNSANSYDGNHPYGFEKLANIAPKVAASIKPNLGARRFAVSLAV